MAYLPAERDRDWGLGTKSLSFFPRLEAGVPVSLAQMEKQLSAAREAGRHRLPCSPGGEGCTAGAYK